jgi:LysW-gamma-L-lysine carboxypeptidase
MTWSCTGDEVELLCSMVDIPSVSGAESRLVAMLAEETARAGFDTHVDAVGNLHCAVGDPAGPEIMLLGHVDTVPGEPPVRLAGGVLTGRGTVDAKGPLAAMICAAARIREMVEARIVVVGAVGEEAASEGSRHLVHRPPPDALLIGEPSGVHHVGIGYKGVLRFRAEFRQPLAHTSSAQATAAEVGYDFWQRLTTRLTAGTAVDGPLFDRVMPTLVEVRGGLERCTVEVSCRVPPRFDRAGLLGWLDAQIGPDQDGRITVLEDVPAVSSPRSDPVVRALTAAVRQAGGRPVPKLKLGTSDWNVVGPVWQVPTAAYGPGNSRLCHTAGEQIEISEYLASIDILAAALPRIAEAVRTPAGDPVGAAPGGENP